MGAALTVTAVSSRRACAVSSTPVAVPLVAVGHTVVASLSGDDDEQLGHPQAEDASPVAAEPPLRPQELDPQADPALDLPRPVEDDDARTH